MFFKNARIYSLRETLQIPMLELSAALEQFKFHPCQDQDFMRYGFVAPLGGDSKDYTHQTSGFVMVCCKKQEKIIPSASVNELLDEKIKQISREENRPVGRTEIKTLKDEIIYSLLPKALKKSSLHYAYIDTVRNLIICNSSSASAAEDIISKLREAVGSVKSLPVSVKNVTAQTMTHWLKPNEVPQHFAIGDSCELKASKDGRIIRAQKQDLTSSEMINHLESGMYVSKIEMSFKERVDFTVDSDIAIKKIKFSDLVAEKANNQNPETKAEQFDADFFVMSSELREMIDNIINAFGGLNE